MSGWIKVYRTLWDKGWSKKPEYVALWLFILKESTHETRQMFWNGKSINLNPGQFITGRLKMSENTGIHESKVERILKTFEIEQQIEQQKTNTSRLITVLNWSKFQQTEQQNEQRVNNERTTAEQRLNTKQELKNTISNTMSGRAQRFVDYVNKEFGGRRFELTDEVKKKFKARVLSGKYTPEILQQVIRNVKASSFHIKNNYRYATPAFFLREETIEKYKGEAIVTSVIYDNMEPEHIPLKLPQTETLRDIYYDTK